MRSTSFWFKRAKTKTNTHACKEKKMTIESRTRGPTGGHFWEPEPKIKRRRRRACKNKEICLHVDFSEECNR